MNFKKKDQCRRVANYSYVKRTFRIALLCFVLLPFFSCNDDLEQRTIPFVELNVTFNFPEIFTPIDTVVSLFFKDITTKKIYKLTSEEKMYLPEGLYDCSYSTYAIDTRNQQKKKINGFIQSLKILGKEITLNLTFFKPSKSDGFVFEEIFYTGVLTPQKKQYYGCSYFKIRNNTSELLYADSLVLCESQFNTVQKWSDYDPDIMHEAVTVDALYMIPGGGTDVPVKPGESLLIADIAIDHRHTNPHAYDLSTADFEWYDASPNPNHQDIDNPSVPNLDKLYCYTKTIWVPHNRGFKTYLLARLEVDREAYIKDYFYEYSYIQKHPQGNYPMKRTAYKMPNEWVVDCVTNSIESKYVWQVTAPELDRGWTYCSKIDFDKTRYNKSVKRKVAYITPNGREVLQDTNNSTEDFIPGTRPSMMPDDFPEEGLNKL